MTRRCKWLAIACALAFVACEQPPADRPAGSAPDSAPVPPTIAPDVAAPASTTDSLRTSLEALVRGESGDSATWFSAETADVLRAVEVDSAGHAVVEFTDLRDVIPNASSSAGSAMLLGELNAAVFAVDGVSSVEYRMDGSCELFGEWLQYGVCMRYDRPAG